MRPVPITDEFMAAFSAGAERIVVAPPGGDLTHPTIRAVDAVVDDQGFHVRVALEEGDLQKLVERPYLWLNFQSARMPVWALSAEMDAFEWPETPPEPPGSTN